MNEIHGARVVENREVAHATHWLVIEGDEPFPGDYGPGNVLALYVLELDGRWVRHPYTVSWTEGSRVGILFRVIPGGRATPVMAALRPGEVVRFGGRFGAPIAAIVAADATEFVGVSTGTGLGPLHGFAAASLAAGFERPITLYPGFRTRADVPFHDDLDALSAQFAHFCWHPTLSAPPDGWPGLAGRVTRTVPPRPHRHAHFHLVGNGAMVAELRGGLLASGIPAHRLTQEVYFNRTAAPDPAVVAAIAGLVGV